MLPREDVAIQELEGGEDQEKKLRMKENNIDLIRIFIVFPISF